MLSFTLVCRIFEKSLIGLPVFTKLNVISTYGHVMSPRTFLGMVFEVLLHNKSPYNLVAWNHHHLFSLQFCEPAIWTGLSWTPLLLVSAGFTYESVVRCWPASSASRGWVVISWGDREREWWGIWTLGFTHYPETSPVLFRWQLKFPGGRLEGPKTLGAQFQNLDIYTSTSLCWPKQLEMPLQSQRAEK